MNLCLHSTAGAATLAHVSPAASSLLVRPLPPVRRARRQHALRASSLVCAAEPADSAHDQDKQPERSPQPDAEKLGVQGDVELEVRGLRCLIDWALCL